MNNLTQQFNFLNKKVWVTGAGSGIGLEIANNFTQLGAKVIGFDKAFPSKPHDFRCELVDLAHRSEVVTLCQKLLKEDAKLDILIHAAGILCSGGLMDISEEDWHKSIETNVSAIFYLSQQVAPIFKQQRSGVMVTVASNAATTARLNMTAYCASKAAALSLTNCIALELAEYGVRCNTVSPGSTDTPMLRNMIKNTDFASQLIKGFSEQYKLGIPLKKIATSEEIAQTVLFLASDMASQVIMQNIIVDGGATLNH